MDVSSFERDYLNLIRHVTKHGIRKPSRVGETISTFGHMLPIYDLRSNRFPILTTRRIYWKPILGELTAFLRGATTLKEFKDYGCNYWDANAIAWKKNEGKALYNMRVGRVYGSQWRSWDDQEDQLAKLVAGIKADPNSRRHVVSAWNPSDMRDMCLPPCHIIFQCYSNDSYLDLIVYMRSVDICLGLPTDIVLYAALLILLAQQTKHHPGTLTFMLGDTHLYVNHMDGVKTLLTRYTKTLPSFKLDKTVTIDSFRPQHLELQDYIHDDPISYQLNV